MTSPLASLVASGTTLWVDSVDPDEIAKYKALGATGATSNPIIIADLINTGRFDEQLSSLLQEHADDETVAWAMTNQLVSNAQVTFEATWNETAGNDGWVSFELDPLLEDADCPLSLDERIARYVELAKQWSKGQTNRMIKVPATEAGLGAVEEIAAAGIPLNVTLVFTEDQYVAARDAVWRGAQRANQLDTFKSVYSIFVSRVDVYTDKHNADLSDDAQGMVGIVNAKQIWKLNQDFWADKGTTLKQEMIFASTGTKKPEDPKDKYVEALAGSDIQTNPPSINAAVDTMGKTYTSHVAEPSTDAIVHEINAKVDMTHLHDTLMSEGTAKFAQPHKQLIALIGDKRKELAPA